MKTTEVIGLMSGTSLDGVDIAWCEFLEHKQKITFQIHEAETIPYPEVWKQRLERASSLTGDELTRFDYEYGAYLGEITKDFIARYKCQVQLIASHGHTIFHQPDQGYTLQIGHGAAIAAATRQCVICDFRSLDVILGGQGAPLVPIGDKFLFGDFEFCLNLGGFSNISMDVESTRIAYDICPANIALNYFANTLGFDFDKDGELASGGKINTQLLDVLNSLDYYKDSHPKSLGREWLEQRFLPLIHRDIPIVDVLQTLTNHIAIQIGNSISAYPIGKILTTGGGAENSYLVSKIREQTKHEVIIPEKKLVHFKEALVFAFLGLLRSQNRINTFASVTGASRDSSGGTIFYG